MSFLADLHFKHEQRNVPRFNSPREEKCTIHNNFELCE